MHNPADFASFTSGVSNELHRIGQLLIQETLEEMDHIICGNGKRKQNWFVERHEKKHLLTVLGDVYFKKTYFTNKETGVTECLLDRILGLDRNERIAEDAEARILEEAVQTSYRRGGERACFTEENVTKQAVMRKTLSKTTGPSHGCRRRSRGVFKLKRHSRKRKEPAWDGREVCGYNEPYNLSKDQR